MDGKVGDQTARPVCLNRPGTHRRRSRPATFRITAEPVIGSSGNMADQLR